jgi:hypothetical protein
MRNVKTLSIQTSFDHQESQQQFIVVRFGRQ